MRELEMLRCAKCKGSWIPRIETDPVKCPRCGSLKWKSTDKGIYIAWVDWEYEDQLPDLEPEQYDAMFPWSKIKDGIGVRIFPYVTQNRERFYLGGKNP